MVSKASELLPEPDSPVMTTSLSRGISRSKPLRLCSRAPRICMQSRDNPDPFSRVGLQVETPLYAAEQRKRAPACRAIACRSSIACRAGVAEIPDIACFTVSRTGHPAETPPKHAARTVAHVTRGDTVRDIRRQQHCLDKYGERGRQAMQGLNTGDTAWMLASAAMVLFMTPGLAAFYSGMVRKQERAVHDDAELLRDGLVVGASGRSSATRSPSPTASGALAPFIGGLNYLGLNGISDKVAPLAPTIPHSVYAMYQGMFAIITVGLITGAVAERMKFKAYVMFTVLWAIFVYSPLAHWVWQPNGWLFKLGALDFAGGTVVHISSAAAALAARSCSASARGYGKDAIHPHNLPLTVLGAGILWFGWFGFNAGSALARQRPRRLGVPQHQRRRRGRAHHLGRSSRRSTPASRPCSARRRARSPDSSPSPRRPASSSRGPRSSSASHRRHRVLLRPLHSRASSASTTRSTSWASTAWAERPARF